MSCVRRVASAGTEGPMSRTRVRTESERTMMDAPEGQKSKSLTGAALQAGQGSVGDHNDTDQDVLHLDRNAQGSDAILQQSQDQDTQDRTADGAASAGQAGAADDDGG